MTLIWFTLSSQSESLMVCILVTGIFSSHVVSKAGQTGGESVVITFDPHPRLVLSAKTKGISFLSTLEEKKKLLAELKIDHLVIIRFSKEFSNMEASDFIREILVGRIGVKHLIVGYDNHIGKNKAGDMKKILECGELFDFSVEQSDKVFEEDSSHQFDNNQECASQRSA